MDIAQNTGTDTIPIPMYIMIPEEGFIFIWTMMPGRCRFGDSFSFLYDFIMKSSIFPKKFGGDMRKHYEILSQVLKSVHGKRVLEIATGSGSAINFLPNDNQYTGTDISPGLLKKAVKNFRTADFKNAEFIAAKGMHFPAITGAGMQ